MNDMNFAEDDKQKLVEFLNMVAKHAKFELNTTELIQYFKLLSHMQTKMIPKIDANILEVKRIIEAKQEAKQEG
jgi:hypothetical protein